MMIDKNTAKAALSTLKKKWHGARANRAAKAATKHAANAKTFGDHKGMKQAYTKSFGNAAKKKARKAMDQMRKANGTK